MIHGATIRLPGEFLCPSKPSAGPVTFVGRLRDSMQRLTPDDPMSRLTYNLQKVFRILRHGKEVSVGIDRLKPAYIPKESENFPVEVNLKEKVSLQTEEIPESEQEKPRGSSCRQETTTHSGLKYS
ncbi:hypothetical protein TNCV_991021 [Trichonephila clavipes]|nr:hypothetical protein TNCV_991021 [Trichonephila clavipes]